MKTNDLKKGTRIRLANGWEATLEDNRKGNIRMATVYGLYTEMGSVYSHDIVEYLDLNTPHPGEDRLTCWLPVEHTPAQIKCRNMNARLFA